MRPAHVRGKGDVSRPEIVLARRRQLDMSMWNDQARRLFASGEQGQTLVEYALILVLISIGTLAALTSLKDSVSGVFSEVGSML